MRLARGSGVLLHPTSLPGPHGSGDLGDEARAFVRFLADAGQRYWQVLPLVPTGFGGSPYSGLSAFASNPMLVDPDDLVRRGWLDAQAVTALPTPDPHRLDFQASTAFRTKLLRHAAQGFDAKASAADRAAFDAFRSRSAAWLDDFALFMALHDRFDGRLWTTWEAPLARRDRAALAEARRTLAPEIRTHELAQFFFDLQWRALHAECAAAGIQIVGDVPIFVAQHSADVWAHPELFFLDASGEPTVVAGVPPDYFSKTGQRWGNPLYRWDKIAQAGFSWWIERFRATFALVDVLRIDHFRGFAANWEIPASEPTAVKGHWVDGPGRTLFDAVRAALGDLPIIAEDLGVITPDVAALREGLAFPGMRILQFAFGSGPANPYLPHNYEPNTVVYTGTHDNDTTRGWWATTDEGARDGLRRYCDVDGSNVARTLVRLALASVADVALVPLQDVAALGTEARMNVPGVPEGNWSWRFTWDQVPADAAQQLRSLCAMFGRLAPPKSES